MSLILRAVTGLIGLLGFVTDWFKTREIKKSAVTAERLDRAEEVIEAAEERREVEDEVTSLPADDVRARLREWSKPATGL